jgi:hypothetical protein
MSAESAEIGGFAPEDGEKEPIIIGHVTLDVKEFTFGRAKPSGPDPYQKERNLQELSWGDGNDPFEVFDDSGQSIPGLSFVTFPTWDPETSMGTKGPYKSKDGQVTTTRIVLAEAEDPREARRQGRTPYTWDLRVDNEQAVEIARRMGITDFQRLVFRGDKEERNSIIRLAESRLSENPEIVDELRGLLEGKSLLHQVVIGPPGEGAKKGRGIDSAVMRYAAGLAKKGLGNLEQIVRNTVPSVRGSIKIENPAYTPHFQRPARESDPTREAA